MQNQQRRRGAESVEEQTEDRKPSSLPNVVCVFSIRKTKTKHWCMIRRHDRSPLNQMKLTEVSNLFWKNEQTGSHRRMMMSTKTRWMKGRSKTNGNVFGLELALRLLLCRFMCVKEKNQTRLRRQNDTKPGMINPLPTSDKLSDLPFPPFL